MFTPPPSPCPELSVLRHQDHDPQHSHHPVAVEDREQTKKTVGRQTRWTILFVPFVLIAITASTKYITHPAAFDLLSSGWPPSSVSLAEMARVHKHHGSLKRRDSAWATDPVTTASAVESGGNTLATGTGTAAPTPSSSSSSSTPTQGSQTIPPIPTAPPTLPTPFPQPFSAGIPTAGMTVSCLNFFNSMMNSLSFRQCRPLSLLLQSSDDFLKNGQAETNVTALNTLVWGTCNVTPGKDQCVQTTSAFANQLQNACPNELQTKLPPIASDSLIALQAYSLMYDAACTLINPTTNSYCFLNATDVDNPSDLYLYQLPLGLPYPPSAKPTCSTCSKSLLSLYSTSLADKSAAPNLKTLATNYGTGSTAVNAVCGSTFAAVSGARSSGLGFPQLLLPLILGLWLTRTLL